MATTASGDTIQEVEGGVEKIVVIAVDKSKQAEHAFEWYCQYIHKPANKIVLLHAPETVTTAMAQGSHLPDGEWQKLCKNEKDETELMLGKYQRKMQEKNMNGTYRTVYGKPGEAIVAAATDLNANLIIMGTRGMGSIRRTILGSVSDYVIHHAHAPVIVCRQ